MNKDEVQQTILYSLVQICRLNRPRIDRMLSDLGVSSGHEMFLISFWTRDGYTHQELAQQLQVQPATITNMINRMEKAQLLERRQDQADMRVSRVYLTGKGQALQASLHQVWLDAEQKTTVGLNLEERLLLRRLLLHVFTNIQTDLLENP